MSEGLGSIFGGAPYERPETPGYHGVLIGGGPFGQPLSMCAKCGAIVPDTDPVRAQHTAFHDGIQKMAVEMLKHWPDVDA